MTYWHITISSENRMPLFPSESRRRHAVRTIVRVCSDCLVLFCVVDDHVHVLVVGPADRMGRVRSGLWNALKPLTDAPLALPHAKRVRNRDHLEWLVRYFLTQTDHHGLSEELALYSGSCFLELVGARRVPGWETRLFRALPRWTPERLHRIVGLGGDALEPATDHQIRAAGAPRLAFCAAMATAADPLLRGRDSAVLAARGAVVFVGSRAGIPKSELCWVLGITPRGLRMIAGRPVDQELCRAVRTCVGLVDRLHPKATELRLVAPGQPR